MLNAMPLPIGPAEIPNGPAKAEKSQKASHNSGVEGNTTSFASTLEAVHKTSQSMHRESPQHVDEPAVSPVSSKEEDGEPGEEAQANSTDAAIDPLTPSQSASAAIADNECVDGSLTGEGISVPSESATEADRMAGTVTSREQPIVPPQAQSGKLPENHLPQSAAVAQDETPAAQHGDAIIPDSEEQPQPKTNAIKMAAGTSDETSSEIGKTASKDAGELNAQNARAIEAAPYRKIVEESLRQTTDAAAEKKAAIEVPLENVDPDAGELPLNEKGNLSQRLKEMGSDQRKTEMAASSQSQSKAEPAEIPNTRIQATDDAAARQKPWGDAVRETPVSMMNDETGPLTGRQGAFDPTVSFSPAASGSKLAMATGNTPAAASPSADVFHQENFNQLVERALITVRGEQSEARIALKPDQLGHVQMKIVTENNLVTIRIMTESPVARDLIDANAHQLKTELQQQGLNVESIQVSVSDDQHDPNRGARQREAFLRQMAATGRRPAEEERDRGNYGASQPKPGRSGATGIDYFA
jgi:flagellar hook-length control protein FliK